MLRREFLERKLQLIAEDLLRLSGFRDESYEALTGDAIRLAAVERILERIVLRAIDVNEHIVTSLASGAEEKSTRLTYGDTFRKLSDHGVYPRAFAEAIARSAGLRNILVHEYNDIDHRILHASIPVALEQYTTYVDSVRAFVERHREQDAP